MQPDPTAALLARRGAAVARGVGSVTPLAVERGEGSWLIAPDGRRYLDLATGIGVMALGHGHPAVVAAVRAQAGALLHTCIHVATYPGYVTLCERLAELIPHGEKTAAMLVNSGAEAVENAVKIARQVTGRAGVLAFTGAFHGRTLLASSLTSKTGYKKGIGPFAPEVYRLPFPDRYHSGDGLSEDALVARELRRLGRALTDTVDVGNLAAVLVEPVQGEGGFVPAPLAWLQGLRRFCDTHGALLISDEVQSGMGRTGRWAAMQHAGVSPDLSTWAKAMGGGLPIAAVIGRAELLGATVPGTLGGTYGGNPVACAAALATLDVLEQDGLLARATVIGGRIQARLGELAARFPDAVGDVRGLGAMMALELVQQGDPRRPDGALAQAVMAGCRARGVRNTPAGPDGTVIRLLPPLTVSDEELDFGLDALVASVEAALA